MDKILLVEDQRIVGRDIKTKLENAGYSVIDFVDSGRKTIESVEANMPDLILMDINLKGEMDGIETVKKIHEEHDVQVVFLTAYSELKIIERIKETEAAGYILKPLDKDDLCAIIDRTLGNHSEEINIGRGEFFASETGFHK